MKMLINWFKKRKQAKNEQIELLREISASLKLLSSVVEKQYNHYGNYVRTSHATRY